MFDGTAYATTGITSMHDGNDIVFKFKGVLSDIINYQILASKEKEFLFGFYTNKILLGIYDITYTYTNNYLYTGIEAGKYYDLTATLSGNSYTLELNGVTTTGSLGGTGIRSDVFGFNIADGASFGVPDKFEGEMYYLSAGDVEFKFTDDYGTTSIVNTGTAEGDATLSGATLTDFWQTDYSGSKEVKSGYGVFDGVAYATGGTGYIHDGTGVSGRAVFTIDAMGAFQALIGKYNSLAGLKLECLFYINNTGKVVVSFSDDAGNVSSPTSATSIRVGEMNDVSFVLIGNNYSITVNGVTEDFVLAAPYNGTLNMTTAPVELGAWNNTSYPLSGKLAYAQLGTAKYDFTEGSGLTVGDATITNYYDGFWQSSDAKLVQSHCAKFDGVGYGQADGLMGVTPSRINNATYLKMTVISELNSDKVGALVNTAIDASGTGPSNPTYIINHTNDQVYWDLFGAGSAINIASYNDNEIHKLEMVYDGTNTSLYIDDNLIQSVVETPAFDSYLYTQFGKYRFGTREGLQSLTRLEDQDGIIFEVNMAEGAGDVMYPILGDERHYNFGVFDGSTYAMAGTESVHNGESLSVDLVVNPTGTPATQILAGKGNTSIRECLIFRNALNNVYVSFRDSLNNIYTGTTVGSLISDAVNTVNISIITGQISITINGVTENFAIGNTGVADFGTANLSVGAADNGAYLLEGSVYYVKYGYAEFDFNSEIGTTTITNIGSAGGDAILTGATLSTFWGNQNVNLISATVSDFWSETQDVYHYNILNGFDCYEGNVGTVRTPIGTTVSDTSIVQCGTTDYLNENPDLEITKNPGLVWDGGAEPEEYNSVVSGTSTITEESNGTRFYSPDGDSCLINQYTLETGKVYNYYLMIGDITGDIRVYGNGVTDEYGTAGVKTGQFTATGSIIGLTRIRAGDDATISEFYVWEAGTVPSLSPTNPAGKWHNGAETAIQFPESMQAIQDSVPITSLTKNAKLEWVDGEIRELEMVTTGTSTITEVANGTRIYAPDDDSCYIRSTHDIVAGTSYNYYVEVDSITTGRVRLFIGDTDAQFLTAGIHTGVLTPTVGAVYSYIIRYLSTEAVISRFYIWEEGTIPPLFYDEFEADFNNKHMVYSDIEDKKKKGIVVYDTPMTPEQDLKIAKCLAKSGAIELLTDEYGDYVTDTDGYVITT